MTAPRRGGSAGLSFGRGRSSVRGFTLVELMIVITIISVLMVLTIQVMAAFISQARDSATRATLKKIQGLMNDRLNAFYRFYGGGDATAVARLKTTQEYASLKQQYPSINDNLRLMLTRKTLFKKYFPQESADITDQYLYPNIYNKSGLGNEEILYDVLVNSGLLGDTPVGADEFTTAQVSDTDGDGFKEFIDGWGQPIRFYRWPTRLIRATGSASFDSTNARVLLNSLPRDYDLKRDPGDSLNLAGTLTGTYFEDNFHTVQTWHVPLIVSSGADKKFGMYAADNGNADGRLGKVEDADALVDDIASLNTRAGGR